VGYLSESQYRKLKPHRSMSDDSEREKTFANGLRSKVMKPSGKKKKGDNGATVTGGANRSVGPCAAMGSMCGHTNLENNRHSCSVCGHCMYIIGPCCSRFDLETDVQVCGKCEYHGDKEVLNFDDDNEEEEVVMVHCFASSQRGSSYSMLRNMLESDEEEDGDDNDEEVMKTPLGRLPKGVPPSAANKKPAPAAAAAKKSRSPNFSSVEDTFITRAWCSATEDSRKGSGQKQQDFNKTLYARFVSLADEYNGQTRKEFQINMKFRTHK
jgi:hypothetical protein